MASKEVNVKDHALEIASPAGRRAGAVVLPRDQVTKIRTGLRGEVPPRVPISSRDAAPIFEPVHVNDTQ